MLLLTHIWVVHSSGVTGGLHVPEDGPRHTADIRLYFSSLYKHTLNTAVSRHAARTVYKLFCWGYINSAVSPPRSGSSAPLIVSRFHLANTLITRHKRYIGFDTQASGICIHLRRLLMQWQRRGAERWRPRGEEDKLRESGVKEEDGFHCGKPCVVKRLLETHICIFRDVISSEMCCLMVYFLCNTLTLPLFLLEKNVNSQVWCQSKSQRFFSCNFMPTFSNNRKKNPGW